MSTRTSHVKPIATVHIASREHARAHAYVFGPVTVYGMRMARALYEQGYRPFLLRARSHAVYFALASFTSANIPMNIYSKGSWTIVLHYGNLMASLIPLLTCSMEKKIEFVWSFRWYIVIMTIRKWYTLVHPFTPLHSNVPEYIPVIPCIVAIETDRRIH